jgi:hypothetical protein
MRHDVVIQPQDLPCIGAKSDAVVGQLELPTLRVDELRAQQLFQSPDLQADRGLSAPQCLSRAGITA